MDSIKKLLRAIKRRVEIYRTKLLFYSFESAQVELPSDLEIVTIDSVETGKFDLLNDLFDDQIVQTVHERVSRSDIFVYLSGGKVPLCYGWISFQKSFYLYEIDKRICLDGYRFLYDFNTPPDFRKNGYYKTLLANIPKLFPAERFLIGVDSTNIPSKRGIESAGYIPFDDVVFCE